MEFGGGTGQQAGQVIQVGVVFGAHKGGRGQFFQEGAVRGIDIVGPGAETEGYASLIPKPPRQP